MSETLQALCVALLLGIGFCAGWFAGRARFKRTDLDYLAIRHYGVIRKPARERIPAGTVVGLNDDGTVSVAVGGQTTVGVVMPMSIRGAYEDCDK